MSSSRPAAAQAAAILLHAGDSVATALGELSAGQAVAVRDRGGTEIALLQACGPIPAFHKIAVLPHAPGQAVIKYGEPIGNASRPIRRGEHVHSHNLRSLRGEGDGTSGL
jgi:hypothetical protein